MTLLFIDLETYSETPITCGTHRYAENAEILLFTWAIDDQPVQVWDLTTGDTLPEPLQKALSDRNVIIYAHNSHFDRTLLKYTLPGIVAGDVTRWRDTMVKALAHGLPGALNDLCDIFNVAQDRAKDKAGKTLIQLFCKPRPKNSKIHRATPQTHPVEWQRFVEYAALDITAMREINTKLPDWNYSGDELALWHRDQEINDRGVRMDIELAGSALMTIEQEQQRLAALTQLKTDNDVQTATQRDAMLKHIATAFGVVLPDMQASTLQRRMNDPDLPVALRELLAIRLQASSTSTSKYKTLLKGVSSDNRLRGTLQFCGASRTGRWAGRMFQPQNLPRPTLEQADIDFGIQALKAGAADLLIDDIMQLTSSTLRGCIIAPPFKKLVVSDLSNIEGRVLAWLAGETWKLQAFCDHDAGLGADLYKLAYAKSFNIKTDEVTKDQRQIGKVLELGLGYGGGVGAFLTFATAYNMNLDDLADAALPHIPAFVKHEAVNWYTKSREQNNTYGLSERVFITCDALKRLWRNAHPATVSFWYELEETVKHAIGAPGHTFTCRKLKVRREGAWLRIVLPSGRAVCYPSPRVEEGKISHMGVNPYSRKWQRLHTYSGKLVENVTQAVARDVLASNMPRIEEAGYGIVLTVHDEVITETADTRYYTADALSALLSTNPKWANGLPLSAGGFETYRYRKD